MKRDPVQSSAIRAVGFDPRTNMLEVEFASGSVYRYFDVPEFLHRGFMVASSKGAYFNTRINGRYRYEEIR